MRGWMVLGSIGYRVLFLYMPCRPSLRLGLLDKIGLKQQRKLPIDLSKKPKRKLETQHQLLGADIIPLTPGKPQFAKCTFQSKRSFA